jgi:hypothetical protein
MIKTIIIRFNYCKYLPAVITHIGSRRINIFFAVLTVIASLLHLTLPM